MGTVSADHWEMSLSPEAWKLNKCPQDPLQQLQSARRPKQQICDYVIDRRMYVYRKLQSKESTKGIAVRCDKIY
jgi:hypothetical protein